MAKEKQVGGKMSCKIDKLSYTPDKNVLKSIVIAWHGLSKGEYQIEKFDLFIKFISAWVLFNAIYEIECNCAQYDREKVKKFCNLDDMKELHHKLMDDTEYSSAVNVLAKNGILKLPNRNGKATIEDAGNLEQVMMCVY